MTYELEEDRSYTYGPFVLRFSGALTGTIISILVGFPETVQDFTHSYLHV